VKLMNIPDESWLDGRIDVTPSPTDGLGLFATARINAGELVMKLGGGVITDAAVREMIARGDRYDGIVLDDDMNLVLKPRDWPGIYGNHSCDPNIWLTPPVDLTARRHINAGDEIAADYATYTMSADWQMECSCGALVCRGTVTGNDWRLPELQAKYAGHFAAPIARRIS
jgi:hypothetical protein